MSDPYANVVFNSTNLFEEEPGFGDLIHVRVVSRNARKRITTIHGLEHYLSTDQLLMLAKNFSRILSCTSQFVRGDPTDLHITLQGDHRLKVAELILEQSIVKKEAIVVHGY